MRAAAIAADVKVFEGTRMIRLDGYLESLRLSQKRLA
ncbi:MULTISPECIES: hypothetical protein [Paraburkholderia]